MRILVTGGAGFIGAHLANRLQGEGGYVRVLDDLSSGDSRALQPGINFNRGDVREMAKLRALLHGADVVYHLAALVSTPASVPFAREYDDVNVGGTLALLEACRDVGVKRVVLASSATVYGDQARQPVTENLDPNPSMPYAVSKLAAENYLFMMGRLGGFETVALRIFNAYGPGQRPVSTHAAAIAQLMQQIVDDGPMVAPEDEEQTQDFVYIDDVVNALISAGVASDVDQQVINVGSGEETSISQLLKHVGATEQVKAPVVRRSKQGRGIAHLVADLTKAHQLLNYWPRTSLADGLRTLAEQELNAPVSERFI